MGRDGPVHRVPDCRIAAAVDATGKSASEVSLTLDVVHLACVAAAVETATTGIRKASSIAIAQILNFIFILQLVGYFYHCAPPRRSNEQRNSVVPWRNKGDAIHGELLTAGFSRK